MIGDREEKYLPDGTLVKVCERLVDGRIIVREILSLNQHSFWEGQMKIVNQVFDTPPEKVYHEKIEGFRRVIKDLTEEYEQLFDKMEKLKEEEQKQKDRFKQVEQLKNLEDFIDGKIAYYVDVDSFHLKIIPVEEAKCWDIYEEKKLRLLSLYAKNKEGDIEWRLSDYSDGSGTTNKVYPVTTWEEAVNIMTKELVKRIKETEDRPQEDLYRLALEYKVPVPSKYGKTIETRKRRLRQAKIDKLKKELAELEEEKDSD